MFTQVEALFQKRASLLGNEKRQIDTTFGTRDSNQSRERTRPRHHPAAMPITKMASGVLSFWSHEEIAATSSDWVMELQFFLFLIFFVHVMSFTHDFLVSKTATTTTNAANTTFILKLSH